jgi:hypothetical protein
MIVIQFSIYLRAELNIQWPNAESAQTETATATKQTKNGVKAIG